MMEEYGMVIDYLPMGKAESLRKEPIAQLVGEKSFTLLEVVVKGKETLKIGEKVYIGRELDKRKKVDRVKDRISYEGLTSSSKNEIENVIKEIVISREKEFVEFFNKCGPISIRQHQLELFPGIGKKHLDEILSEREKKSFNSFKDIEERARIRPVELLASRIVEELKGSRFYIFTRPKWERREEPREGRRFSRF